MFVLLELTVLNAFHSGDVLLELNAEMCDDSDGDLASHLIKQDWSKWKYLMERCNPLHNCSY